jgi:cytochrome P450
MNMTHTIGSPFSSPAFRENPYTFYAHLVRQAPVYRTSLPDGSEVYTISRYADVLAGLKDERLIKNIGTVRPSATSAIAPAINNASMLKSDPPQHTRLRAFAHAAFTPKVVYQLRGRIQEIADRLVDAVEDRGRMDLINDYAFPLPITVICEMLGVPPQDAPQFRAWTNTLIASGALSSEMPQLRPELLPLLQYLHALITKRRAAPQADLISALAQANQQGDQLTEAELLGTAVLLLVAGHETTVNLIGNGMLALLTHAEQWAQLQRMPARVKDAVEELLRVVNPVQLVNRYAAQDLVMAGVTIPRGSHLVLLLAAADHDPAFVADPAHVDVTRDPAKHVAFGQGIHYCLGAPLARLEGEIAITTLLKRLPNLRLAIAPEDVIWRPAIELRGLQSLPVTF